MSHSMYFSNFFDDFHCTAPPATTNGDQHTFLQPELLLNHHPKSSPENNKPMQPNTTTTTIVTSNDFDEDDDNFDSPDNHFFSTDALQPLPNLSSTATPTNPVEDLDDLETDFLPHLDHTPTSPLQQLADDDESIAEVKMQIKSKQKSNNSQPILDLHLENNLSASINHDISNSSSKLASIKSQPSLIVPLSTIPTQAAAQKTQLQQSPKQKHVQTVKRPQPNDQSMQENPVNSNFNSNSNNHTNKCSNDISNNQHTRINNLNNNNNINNSNTISIKNENNASANNTERDEDEDEDLDMDLDDDGEDDSPNSQAPTSKVSAARKRKQELHRRHSKRYRDNIGVLFQNLELLLPKVIPGCKLKTKSQIISHSVQAVVRLRTEVASLEMQYVLSSPANRAKWVEDIVHNATCFQDVAEPFMRLLLGMQRWKHSEFWGRFEADMNNLSASNPVDHATNTIHDLGPMSSRKFFLKLIKTASAHEMVAQDVPTSYQSFSKLSQLQTFIAGDDSLVGRIATSLSPDWIDLTDPDSRAGFKRADAATHCGFKVCFAVPFLIRGHVFATVLFFDDRQRSDIGPDINIAQDLASSLGNCYGASKMKDEVVNK